MRDQLLPAVRARLLRIEEAQDLTLALEPTALDEAQHLASILREDDSDLEARSILGWLYWYRYWALPEGQDREALEETIQAFTPCFIMGTEILPEPLLPLLADNATGTAVIVLRQALTNSDLALITTAVSLWKRILTATLADHPDRAGRLSNLGIALDVRFKRSGAMADLHEAIDVSREAVAATPTDHPDRATILSHLGGVLRVRFGQFGVLADLDEAIDVSREAVAATPTDQPDRARYLSNLGIALRVRFERSGGLGDLNEAIRVGREAVKTTPADHPNWAGRLSNLGNALGVRFERSGALADLEEAIRVSQEAVAATPTNHLDRAGRLSSLGGALLDRFERSGGLVDLNGAIRVGREAVAATPADHPNRAAMLSNLGRALRVRFERFGVLEDLDEVIGTYIQAAEVESGAPSIRIRAARVAAALGAQTDAQTSANLLGRAVRLLAEVAPRQLDRGDQQYALGQFAGLSSDAAALALFAAESNPSGENPATRALRLLELGRGILLSQALDTRSDLTDLQAHHPALAARFIELRDQLDQPGDTTAPADDAGVAAAWGQHRAGDRRHLAAAFQATVAEIRSSAGFKTFLLPPEPDQLLHHAEHGPIVVVNVSRYRSDAIILTPDGITNVPLPDLTQDGLIDRIKSFQQALATAHDPEASRDQREDAQHTLSTILEWLWDAAASPILDELGHRYTPAPKTTWPRLWWVPGGLLGFLPIHAAGYHRAPPGPDGARRTVIDRVVSSYTPTVRALGYAREHTTTSTTGDRALIVAMPTTPGNSPLHNVAKEAELVHQRLPNSTLLIEDPASTNPELPTKTTVLDHLNDCAIAHFACHGSSHLTDPSLSLLLLHDHDTDPLTVASLAPIRLDHAQMAYLSACRTAFNASTNLIDEAIHLTTAFQLAGYPHVVGTLWEIDDIIAVRVADAFYTTLTTSDNTIDTTGAAQALHHAVRAIRDELPATPSLWAAYLHAGA